MWGALTKLYTRDRARNKSASNVRDVLRPAIFGLCPSSPYFSGCEWRDKASLDLFGRTPGPERLNNVAEKNYDDSRRHKGNFQTGKERALCL